MMLLTILTMIWAQAATPAVSEDSVVNALSVYSVKELKRLLPNAQGIERGAALLFLAAADSTDASWSESARANLDSMLGLGKTPLRSVLLGTAEALRARDTQKDEIQATLWLGKSFRHLDEGVKAKPEDPLLRIFRINSLVDVPEMFHVDARLKEDCDFLRARVKGGPRNADTGTLMALASVAWRNGRSREAIAMWKLVVSKEKKDSPDRKAAERRLERSRG